MDNVLFYGQGDDASRRQVRSAATQHSHRVGPRKPKKGSGKESVAVKKRTAHQKSVSTASSSTDSPDDAGEATFAHPTARPLPTASASAYRGEGAAGRRKSSIGPKEGHDERGTKGISSSSQSLHRSPALRPVPAQGSSYQRLPQYSWTEYPRYGLSSGQPQSLKILAQVASGSQQYAGRTTVDRPQLPPPHSSRSLFVQSPTSDSADVVKQEQF
ncbi:hypothetical protein AC578_8835 [Pseudocercospora eumusae]|uniref:Uncharacterized protein n=1 Tax=Pseudocercospora eumusae TaxID=321146 RepID=A0A139H4X2_9PEZI|nr:hypothetical protein AC578_8835 [Pseudocercospora eumusae]